MTKLNVFISVFRPFFPSKTRFIARETIVLSIDVKYSFPKQAKFIKGLIRRFYGRFDKIVCQSEDMKNDLVSHFAQDVTKTIVINNPIDVVSIQKQIAKVGKESQQVPRLVSVGRLAPQKGFDRLLQAVSQLPIDFRFDIIGEGAEHERLIELVQKLGITEKVRFLGQLQNPFSIVATSDVYVFGSRYEGFPNVLLEAGVCGVPIVAFRVLGGLNEIIEEGVNGFLVEDGEIEHFREKIVEALNTKFNRKAIQEQTAKRFGLTKIIKQYENLILSQVTEGISS